MIVENTVITSTGSIKGSLPLAQSPLCLLFEVKLLDMLRLCCVAEVIISNIGVLCRTPTCT